MDELNAWFEFFDLTTELSSRAAKYGYVELIKWLFEQSDLYDLTTDLASRAAKYGHLELVKWLIDQGADFTPEICENALSNGYVHIVKWAREEGYEWSPQTHCWIIKLWKNDEYCPYKRNEPFLWDTLDYLRRPSLKDVRGMVSFLVMQPTYLNMPEKMAALQILQKNLTSVNY